MRRTLVASCLVAGGVTAWLTVGYPLGSFLGLRKLRRRAPEMFDGPVALAAVLQAISEDGYV